MFSIFRKNFNKHLYTCPAGLCCASIGQYEADDKCYNQISYFVITIRPMDVTTKFVVTAAKTNWICRHNLTFGRLGGNIFSGSLYFKVIFFQACFNS